MEFLPNYLDQYIAEHSKGMTPPVLAVLEELERATHLRVLMPQMLSGQLQGQWLAFLSRMIRPKRVLEIGTFTGYSAICLAQGLAAGGVLDTIDINEELVPMIKKYHQMAGVTDRVRLHVGDATRIIPTLEGAFDLVFIDADKLNYPVYYDLVIDRVPSGGYILIDNVLWSGKVAQEPRDKSTEAIHQLNEKIQADGRVTNFMLPLRDGLLLVRKE